MLFDFLKGTIIGIANIIPGVSGGTLAFILGVYHRLIRAVNCINAGFFIEFFSSPKHIFTKEGRSNIAALLKKNDLFFLMRVGAGAVVSIMLLSGVMKKMLLDYREPVYGLFLGLVIMSILIPYRQMTRKKLPELIMLVLAALLTLFISYSVNPSHKVLENSKRYEQSVSDTPSGQIKNSIKISNVRDYAVVFFSAAAAISAMVLPGISGSFVLILLGQYFIIISAVSNAGMYVKALLVHKTIPPEMINQFTGDILIIVFFAIGCIIGILLFCRLFEYVYAKFPNQTLAGLTGLVVGSCYALWPFKTFIIQDVYIKTSGGIVFAEGYKIYTNQNFLPFISGFSSNISGIRSFAVLIMFCAGVAVMFLFSKVKN